MASSPMRFSVRRREAELVVPSAPTPRELKRLSDIDDQEGLRFQFPSIHFYRHDPAMAGQNPAAVLRDALARALVFYYPFAGRLREGDGRKLLVDCTGEGVLFIEAEADVTLEEFGDVLHPPFPCLEELLFDVDGSSTMLNTPLLLIQVTLLSCGGFILATRVNHTMSDGTGMTQLLIAVGELARGLPSPSVVPVWRRELLEANPRSTPAPSFPHREYDQLLPDTEGATIIPLDDMAHRSFFFGPREISTLGSLLPPQLSRTSSVFDILAAFLWRSRTLAFQPDDPNEKFRIICIVDARGRFSLPSGFYGNAIAFPVAIATARELCSRPLAYAVELVRKAKSQVSGDYLCSVADYMVIKGRPHFTVLRTFVASDITRVGSTHADFGWGKALYSGPAEGGAGAIPGVISNFIHFVKPSTGEKGIVVPVRLPPLAMKRFAVEIQSLLLTAQYGEDKKQVLEAGSNTTADHKDHSKL